jgi:hypothetical protein
MNWIVEFDQLDVFMVGMWMQMYAGLIVDNFGPLGIGETLLKFYRNFGNLLWN